MASRADVERIRSANKGIVALARRDLDAFWSSLDLTKPEAARDALLRFVPELVARYGEIAASVAADWYDDLRAAGGALPGYRATMADLVPADAVTARTRFGAGHLWTDMPQAARDFLLGVVSEYVLQPGRDTIVRNVVRDPWRPRWARVPSGAETCAFCLMLASRGPVYLSEESAGRMRKYHGHCDCVPTPIGPHEALPHGYDPDALYGQYQQARDAAKSSSTTRILAELRQQQDIS